jgi:hypothetical protein
LRVDFENRKPLFLLDIRPIDVARVSGWNQGGF